MSSDKFKIKTKLLIDLYNNLNEFNDVIKNNISEEELDLVIKNFVKDMDYLTKSTEKLDKDTDIGLGLIQTLYSTILLSITIDQYIEDLIKISEKDVMVVLDETNNSISGGKMN